jgi:hypothetical protein
MMPNRNFSPILSSMEPDQDQDLISKDLDSLVVYKVYPTTTFLS